MEQLLLVRAGRQPAIHVLLCQHQLGSLAGVSIAQCTAVSSDLTGSQWETKQGHFLSEKLANL